MNGIARQHAERQNEIRRKEQEKIDYLKHEARTDLCAKILADSDMRSSIRRIRSKNDEADNEFQIAKSLYDREKTTEIKRLDEKEQDAIANALAEKQSHEFCDKKRREALRESSAELRDVRAKLQLALVNQERYHQVREKTQRIQEEKDDSIAEGKEIVKRDKDAVERERQEEQARLEAAQQESARVRDQLIENERRRQLLEQAQRVQDKQLTEALRKKERDEFIRNQQIVREKQQKNRREIDIFMKQKEEIKRAEQIRLLEEKKRVERYIADVDERLQKAINEQRARDAYRERVAAGIADTIQRQRKDKENYEKLIIDLAMEKEMQKLKEREAAEKEKIRRQCDEIRQFMGQYALEKQRRAQNDRVEEEKIKKQIQEQQARLVRIEEIEEEKVRIGIDKYRRELERQTIQRREMAEAARQEELRKLRANQQLEIERQKMIEEERRNLVINHLMQNGPESIRFLPKGVLKAEDLDYLPEEFQNYIIKQGALTNGY